MATTKAPGLLLAMVDIPPELEADFNHWYDTEHIPERLAVPGFVGAQRYQAIEGEPKYQALYELESVDVLESPEYKRVSELRSEGTQRIMPQFRNLQRGVYTQIFPEGAQAAPAPAGTKAVLLVGLAVPPEREEEFHAWYNTEHIPFLSAVPGVLRARRFAPTDGSRRYLAVYEFADPDVMSTEAWEKAANTPWSARQRQWYDRWLRVRSRALTPVTA